MTVVLKVEVPETAFAALRSDREGLSREMCLAAAIKWYESGRISQEKAAEISGLSREAFILALAHYNTSPVQYSVDEMAEELERG